VTETPTALPNAYAYQVIEFLTEEGFRPKLDADGDVLFKYEGCTYIVITVHNDPTSFCLLLPYFWPIEDPAERIRALEAAMHAQRTVRIGRVTVLDDDVTASVDAYLPDEGSFRTVLLRSLEGLRCLGNMFREQMRAQLEN